MDSLKLWARDGAAVRQAIELGEIAHIETASEELTDEFLLFAIESGLVKTWAETFPDPRGEPEIGMGVIIPAHLAARFAGLSSKPTKNTKRRSEPRRSRRNWWAGTTSRLASRCCSTPVWGRADGFTFSIRLISRCL